MRIATNILMNDLAASGGEFNPEEINPGRVCGEARC